MLESDAKMQDELANMMAHNLHLSNSFQQPPQNASMPTTPQVVPHTTPITYISQHYHHSAHQVPVLSQPEVPTTMLANAGVDPSALSPSQLHLFKNALPDQQLRLIELWRIAPPTPSNQIPARDPSNLHQTNMQQEEEAARDRWEIMEQEKYKNLSAPEEPKTNAEPYIVTGYDSLCGLGGVGPTSHGGVKDYCQANDPVYQSREWWHMSEPQPVEHLYGLFQHMYGQPLHQFAERREDEEML
jgi:hypothetical protein